jgi:hypothetical protein
MDNLIKQALKIYPNFNQLTTQQQYEILKNLNPKITPEDLIYHYEQKYYDISDENWINYLETYMQ